VEHDQARHLLAEERKRVEGDVAAAERGGFEESDERREPGDFASEGLYQDELDSGILTQLKRRLDEVGRAEERLAAGTYGLSVLSGDPIPDKRLIANPCAELTYEEAQERR
jgi:DnaK suppressor protein